MQAGRRNTAATRANRRDEGEEGIISEAPFPEAEI
jgi:hypothetical protein